MRHGHQFVHHACSTDGFRTLPPPTLAPFAASTVDRFTHRFPHRLAQAQVSMQYPYGRYMGQATPDARLMCDIPHGQVRVLAAGEIRE